MRTWTLRGRGYAAGAFLAGLVTGAGLSSLPGLLGGPFVIIAFVIALAPWIVAMTFLGGPLWLVLHRLGLRSPLHFALGGAGMAFTGTVILLLMLDGMRPAGVPATGSLDAALVVAALLAGVGAVVGVVMQLIAYERGLPSPARVGEVFQ